MHLISVIVPIYNVEKYLDKCIESIINQSYQNIEIILVNDGSSDSCGKMCDEWAKKNDRIRVIHKKNGGLSDARNTGLGIAKGEYISFIDSDDWIEPTFLEVLYRTMQQEDVDIVGCGIAYIDEKGSIVRKKTCDSTIMRMSNVTALTELIKERNITQTVWNKLYKKTVITGIGFEVGKHHEDDFWTYQVFDKANRVVVIQDVLYNYLQRESSIMGGGYTIKRMDGLEARFRRMEYLQKYEELALFTRTVILYDCMYHFQAALKYLKPMDQKIVTDYIVERLKDLPKFKDYGDIITFKYKIWFSLFRKHPFAISKLRNRLGIGG